MLQQKKVFLNQKTTCQTARFSPELSEKGFQNQPAKNHCLLQRRNNTKANFAAQEKFQQLNQKHHEPKELPASQDTALQAEATTVPE